jgi:molybdopterin synthase catalytic subunit
MIRVEIVEGPLPVPRELGFPTGTGGAVVEFQGVVRGTEDGRPIRGIGYECHREMARHQLQKISEGIVADHRLIELIVLHRVGPVPTGETSLYVRAVAPHREEAFAAAGDLITKLKRDVPIWKHPIER